MSPRCNILPEPQFAGLRPVLTARLEQAAGCVVPGNFASLLDPLMREVLRQGFVEAGASEGTAWLLDEEGRHLIPGFNSGPHADRLVGLFKQPLGSGLVCMVFASEQPFLENEVFKNARQSKLADTLLGVQTYALIAVPFSYLGRCRGVLSCVQLKTPGSTEPDPPGFDPPHLKAMERTASLLSRLLEYSLLSRIVDWESD